MSVRLVATLALLLAVAACGSDASTSPTPASPQAAPSVSGGTDRTVAKVLVVVVENHSYDEMRDEMPWTAGLAATYGYTDDYRAIAHPSLPNYLAMIGGDTFGVTDDDPPAVHPVSGPTVLAEALAAGRTAAVYADAMPAPCATEDSDTYAVRHNAWAYFTDERTDCQAHDRPLDGLAADAAAGDLPNVGLVIPDVCHDAHDCPLSTADAWIAEHVGPVLEGPDFRAGRLALVVTADEDDRTDDNRILTVVAHPGVAHAVVHASLDHYALSRALAEVAGVAPLGHAADTRSLLAAFGLRAG